MHANPLPEIQNTKPYLLKFAPRSGRTNGPNTVLTIHYDKESCETTVRGSSTSGCNNTFVDLSIGLFYDALQTSMGVLNIGDGCVNTTAKELFLWDRALQHNRILPKNEQDSAYIPARLNNGSPAESEPGITYGFGWIIEDNPELGTIIGHNGGWPGYQTLNWRLIGNDRTVICFVTAEPPAW